MFVPQFVQDLAQEYLFESTQQMLAEMGAAATASDVAEVLVDRAKVGGVEFWLDVSVVLSVIIITVAFLNCFGRFFCWFFVSMPKQAKEIRKIRDGSMEYQRQAEVEREERKRSGEKDYATSMDEDFRLLSQAMTEMRNGIRQSEAELLAKERNRSVDNCVEKESTKENAILKRTTRKVEAIAPVSMLRGMTSIDVLVSSPNYRYLVLGSRSKKRTYVIPQTQSSENPTIFLSRGKDMLKKDEPQTILEELDVPLPTSVNRMEVYSAQFVPSSEHSTLIAGERNTDAFFIFQLSGDCEVRLQRTIKMPHHRLVSGLSPWSIVTTGAGMESLLHFKAQDCVVELLHPTGDTFVTATSKFKIGNATAWCHCRDLVAVGGTFMREPRLARVERREHNGNVANFELKTVATISNGHGSVDGAAKLRVQATALVQAGQPAFNTRNYWILLMEDGVGEIYDLDAVKSAGAPERVCTFKDTDYAEHIPEEPVRLLVDVQGSAYKERLVVLLIRGGNTTVLHQGGFALPFEMVHRQDIYDSLNGEPIEYATFLLNGRGLALCGKDDHRGVRFFELPE